VATVTPIPQTTSTPTPLHLWHLLSLDAPTIAALWTWFIASANHIRLPRSAILAMAIAVWMLYAADRLLDAQSSLPHHLEPRHHFHHRHRPAFLTGILVASIVLAVLLPRLSPEALPLYLILGGLLSGYFILIHAIDSAAAHRLPKEIAVGIFFAAATFIPTVARQPDLRLPLLPSALLFATLCSLNCLFIYAWEHSPKSLTSHHHHPAHRLVLRYLRQIATLVALVGAGLACLGAPKLHPIPLAAALSAVLLQLLHHRRHHLHPTTLRAAADLALTTPILFLAFPPHLR